MPKVLLKVECQPPRFDESILVANSSQESWRRSGNVDGVSSALVGDLSFPISEDGERLSEGALVEKSSVRVAVPRPE